MTSSILWSPDFGLSVPTWPGINSLAAGQGVISTGLDLGTLGDKPITYAGFTIWNVTAGAALNEYVDLYILTGQNELDLNQTAGAADLVGSVAFDPTIRLVDNLEWVNRTFIDQVAAGFFISTFNFTTANRVIRWVAINRTSVPLAAATNLVLYRRHTPAVQDPV